MRTPGAKKVESFLEQIQISEKDIMKRLHKLKTNKSAGPDSIHPRLLKELSNELTKPLALLFKKSLQEALIPQQWKKSHVSPIHKNGHCMQPNNYRPVSLMSMICKILEKIARQTVMEHLIDNGLINDNQHGFVPGRSCITWLLVALDHWTDILDNHCALDAIYLDFAKAFDKVLHERLLLKVENHGIKGNVLEWIRDFLSNRQQRVVINGTHSAWAPVTSGIPQGSVLGPLLFVIFVNDMPDMVKSFLYLYVCWWCQTVYKSQRDRRHYSIPRRPQALSNWADTWQLTFNAKKCKTMHQGNNNPKTTYSLATSAGVSLLEPTQAKKTSELW